MFNISNGASLVKQLSISISTFPLLLVSNFAMADYDSCVASCQRTEPSRTGIRLCIEELCESGSKQVFVEDAQNESALESSSSLLTPIRH